MKRMRRALLGLSLLGLPVHAAGCNPKPIGQLVLVVQTDLSIPKDIDTVRIEAFNDGVPKFQNDYSKIGQGSEEIRLPGTITLVASSNPSDAITIVVSAWLGGTMNGRPRIVSKVVTTVPATRTAMLQLPLDFLCLDQAELDATGDAVSTCADGKSCVAGTCEDQTVDSSTLPDYSAGAVSGDGTCFDAADCWTSPTVVVPDASCTLPNATDINLALQTEAEGICGPVGCYVTLNENDPENGWTVDPNSGRIILPSGVCVQLKSGQIVNVVAQPTSASCGAKQQSLPTCGPWSAAPQNPPPYAGPLALAGGQPRPVTLGLLTSATTPPTTQIFWTNGGVSGAQGSLKSTVPSGGKPGTVMSTSEAPRALVVVNGDLLWTDAPGTTGTGSIYKATGLTGTGTAPTITQLVMNLDSPEGIAFNGNPDASKAKIFWSDFQDGNIWTAGALGTEPSVVIHGQNYPYRVAADFQYVYWTNEGTMGVTPPDGSVSRYDYTVPTGTPVVLASAEDTPRAIALDQSNGVTQAVYFATFAATTGEIVRVKLPAGMPPAAPEVLVTGQKYPNGILVDGGFVYWTDRDAGTVSRIPTTAAVGVTPTVLATLQEAPGQLAVDSTSLYWVNEGSSSAGTGAIIKLTKP